MLIPLIGGACLFPLPALALTLSKVADAGLGRIEYSAPPSGNISMGTNGIKQYSGSFNGDFTGTAGAVEVQDDPGTDIEISCAPATLANASGDTIATTVEIAAGTGNRGNWGDSIACTDIASPVTSLTVGASPADNTLYFGMRIAPSVLTTQPYQTSNPNGQGITVRVVIH